MKLFITTILTLLTLFTISCSDAQTGNEIVLKVSPIKLNFKTISVGDTDVQYFTLKNIGNGDLKITSMEVTVNPELYKIKNDLKYPIIIKKGESYKEDIEVEYTAKEVEGSVSGKLEIKSNDSTDEIKTVYLSAEKANPNIKVSVETIIFNKLNLHEAEEFDLVVYNTGTSALKFEKYDDEGNLVATNKDAFEFGNGTSNSFELVDLENVRTLEPVKFEDGNEVFDSFTIKVRYTANGEGTETGTLKIYNNSVNSSPLKIINIMASSESCDLVLQPRDGFVDFGERPQGSTNSFTVLLANKGAHECELKNVEIDQENTSPEFSIELPENTTFPVIIPATERFQFKIIFKPTEDTGTGGAVGIVNMEANDERWNGGKKQITISGRSKEDNSPVCILKDLYGGEPYFEVEPGQREAVECEGAAVCSNVQMISESYDPDPNNTGTLTHTWRMVDSPAAYTNPDWISFPRTDPDNVSNSDHHYVDVYVPFATPPGTKYLVELTVTSESGLSSKCYGEIHGLTGNSLHVEMFWDIPSDVDLHVMNPTDQNLNIDDIDIEYPSQDEDLENWRERTNIEWWDTGDSGRDCHWRNCKGNGIEWGDPGRADNPSLDRDDIPGTGPENINIAKPKEGWYRVSSHYYNNPDGVETDVHIRVYCNGTVAYQKTAHLSDKNYTWLVNDIYWEDLGNNDGQCYIFSDGRIFNSRQGEDQPGYRGTLIEDIEPDNE